MDPKSLSSVCALADMLSMRMEGLYYCRASKRAENVVGHVQCGRCRWYDYWLLEGEAHCLLVEPGVLLDVK